MLQWRSDQTGDILPAQTLQPIGQDAMLGQLLNRFATPLYVQLWQSRIRVTDLATGRVFEDEPLLIKDHQSHAVLGIGRAALAAVGANNEVINPFSHPRVLFADFACGQLVLAHAVKSVLPKRGFAPNPFLIIHPMEKTEGGLTVIEKRAFLELGLSVGASDARVYQGVVLSAHSFDLAAFKAITPKG